MNSMIEHFSPKINACEFGFSFLTATEVDRDDAGHEWIESMRSPGTIWSLGPDDEESPDDDDDDDGEFVEEEVEEEEIEDTEAEELTT
jgi:hypothetical protein